MTFVLSPGDSVWYWAAVTAVAFVFATVVLRRWVMGRGRARREAAGVGAFVVAGVAIGLLPSLVVPGAKGTQIVDVTDAMVLWWGAGLACGLLGLAVLARAIVGDPSRGRRRCGKCWYDMSGTPGLKCPECGRETRSERGLFRTRRRKRWFAAAGVLLVGAGVGAVVPVADEVGWEGLVPDVAIVLMLPWMDDDHVLLLEFELRFHYALDDARIKRWQRGWRSRLMVRQCRAALAGRAQDGVFSAAMGAMGNIGRPGSAALEQLLTWAQDQHQANSIRVGALLALTSLPENVEQVVPVFVACMDDAAPRIRRVSIACLSFMSEAGALRPSDATASLFAELAVHPDEVVRSLAITPLVHHTRDAAQLHPLLLRLARDPSAEVRLKAVASIAEFGPHTEEGFEELFRIAELPPVQAGSYAPLIFVSLSPSLPIEQRLSLLERALSHDVLRAGALRAIAELGDQARPLLPALTQLKEQFDAQRLQDTPPAGTGPQRLDETYELQSILIRLEKLPPGE